MSDEKDSCSPQLVEETCWECGEQKLCFEYTVCCTGTRFYICPDCADAITQDCCTCNLRSNDHQERNHNVRNCNLCSNGK